MTQLELHLALQLGGLDDTMHSIVIFSPHLNKEGKNTNLSRVPIGLPSTVHANDIIILSKVHTPSTNAAGIHTEGYLPSLEWGLSSHS